MMAIAKAFDRLIASALSRVGLLCLAATIVGCSQAYGFPDKQVTIIVPYTGGPSDLIGRLLSQKLRESWGQPVIFDARTGAGGNLGVSAVAKAPPDGHTLLVTAQPPLVINQYLYSRLPFDPVKDFEPIMMLTGQPMLLAINASVPANSVAEFVALAKSKRLIFASGGNGTTPHLASEVFLSAAGIRALHVPYRTVSQMEVAVLSGEAHFAFMGPRILEHVQSGKMRVLVQTGETRATLAPNVPTTRELGLNYNLITWNGLLAPRGTPEPILDKIAKDVGTAMVQPNVAKRLHAVGLDLMIKLRGDFGRAMAEERRIWQDAVRNTGARVD